VRLASTIPTATAVSTAARAEIVAEALNVRVGPGMGYRAIGGVAKGDVLEISGVSADGNWLQIITADGEPGWISRISTYTRVIGSLEDVPVKAVEPISEDQSAKTVSLVATQGTDADDKLVFATSSGGDLYVVNADGTGLRKLTSGVIDPVVSPDGQQVAFTRWDNSQMGALGSLWVINVDGTGERRILEGVHQPKSPTWSSDGTHITISMQHGGNTQVVRDCVGDSQTRDIPRGAFDIEPRIDGDGDMDICYSLPPDPNYGLRQVDLTTGQFEDLAADLYSFSPTWDPRNSSRIIYDGERGLMQLDLSSGKLQPFTSDVRDTAPVFSPDGSKLALTYKQHDHWEVYTYDLATGSRQRLTKPPILADPQYNSAAPAWSPDGSQIAFLTDRSGQWEIWVMNADGSNQHALFSSEMQAQLEITYWGMNERMLSWS
jgi:TolB protein